MKPYSLRLYYISSRKYITDLQQHKFLALLPCSLLLTIGVTQFACSDVERGVPEVHVHARWGGRETEEQDVADAPHVVGAAVGGVAVTDGHEVIPGAGRDRIDLAAPVEDRRFVEFGKIRIE